jgi:hypothetical protein
MLNDEKQKLTNSFDKADIDITQSNKSPSQP